jgi:hypothetical protein
MPFASPTAPDICVVGASSFGLGLRKRSGGWRWGWASEPLGRRNWGWGEYIYTLLRVVDQSLRSLAHPLNLTM